MNCGNCGTPLNPGSYICPKCGAKNVLPDTPATNMSTTNNQPSVPTQENNIIDTINLTSTQDTTQVQEEVVPIVNGEEQNNLGIDDGAGEVKVTQVDASIAPPTLEVSKENLKTASTDWSTASTNVSDYGQEGEKGNDVVMPQEKSGATTITNSSVQIQIPAAADNVEPGTLTTGVEEISTIGDTVGAKTSVEETKKFKFGKKEIRLKGGSTTSNKKLIIYVIISLAIGLFLGKSLFSTTISVASRCETSDVSTVADGKNNITEIGGYQYQIPEKYSYDKQDNGLIVYDKDGLFRIYIRVCDGDYEQAANAKESIKATLTAQEVSVSEIKEITVLEKYSYITINTTKNMTNRLVAITSGKTEGKLFYVEVVYTNNTIDTSSLDLAADIINNSKAVEVSDIEKMDVNDIFDLISTTSAAQESLIGK